MKTVALLASLLLVGIYQYTEATTTEVSTTTVPGPTTDGDVTDVPTVSPTTKAPVPPTTKAPVPPTTKTTPGPTTLSNPTPIPELIETGGVEAELGTTYSTWDKPEFRNVIAYYSTEWCTAYPTECTSSDPLVVSGHDVVVYEEGACSDYEGYACVGEDNMVAAFYVKTPSQEHELLMTSDSLTRMLQTYEDELYAELGYTVSVPEVVDDTGNDMALEPWVIALILFLILVVIVVLIIVWVWYRRKQRLEKMMPDDLEMNDIMKHARNGTGVGPLPGMKDESTLVYQAWILNAMKQGEVSTQVRKADIEKEMTDVESSRPDVIVAKVAHEDETKETKEVEAPIVTTASIEPPPVTTTDVVAEMPKDPPHYEQITEVSPPPPPPEIEPPKETEEPLPSPPPEAEKEALSQLDNLIEEGGQPSSPLTYDNPAYELVDDETGTALQDGSLTTAL